MRFTRVAVGAFVALIVATFFAGRQLEAHPSAAHPSSHARPRRAAVVTTSGQRPGTPAHVPRAVPPPPSIALTFDDGPDPYYTDQILQTLRRFTINATFFVVGREVALHPDTVRAVAADGNEVENHTWDHADLAKAPFQTAINEIASTADEVLLLTGRAPRYLRPPYGSVDQAVRADATAMGERTVLWNVDPQDWTLPGVQAIETNVLANARDGAIVIMHDGGGRRDETVAALQKIIPALRARGFRFVTVQQMLDPLTP